MTELECPKCKESLVMFNETYVKEHKKEENWLMARCSKCDKFIGTDGRIY